MKMLDYRIKVPDGIKVANQLTWDPGLSGFLKAESELENRTRERVVWDTLWPMLLALKMEETSREPRNVGDF